jgi:hypothetical protein
MTQASPLARFVLSGVQASVAASSRCHPVWFDQRFQKTPVYTSSPLLTTKDNTEGGQPSFLIV